MPGGRGPGQATGMGRRGKNRRTEVTPLPEGFAVTAPAVPLDGRFKPAPRNRFEKTRKDAIAVLHARSLLSLDNQKVTGSRRFYRASIRDTVTHSPDSPALARGRREWNQWRAASPIAALVQRWRSHGARQGPLVSAAVADRAATWSTRGAKDRLHVIHRGGRCRGFRGLGANLG